MLLHLLSFQSSSFIFFFGPVYEELFLLNKAASFRYLSQHCRQIYSEDSKIGNGNCRIASLTSNFVFPDTKYLLCAFSMTRKHRIQVQFADADADAIQRLSNLHIQNYVVLIITNNKCLTSLNTIKLTVQQTAIFPQNFRLRAGYLYHTQAHFLSRIICGYVENLFAEIQQDRKNQQLLQLGDMNF